MKNDEAVNSNEMAPRPGTASSVGRKVDELFQVSYTSASICDSCWKVRLSDNYRGPQLPMHCDYLQ